MPEVWRFREHPGLFERFCDYQLLPPGTNGAMHCAQPICGAPLLVHCAIPTSGY